MRLKPVAKRAPQHALCGARRTAFHYKVLPIDKISRVSRIKRKRLEPWERREMTHCPFPSISQHVFDSKCARSFRERIHRHRIPTTQIEIAKRRIGRIVTPRVIALRPLARSISRAVPFFFRRKRFARPSRVGPRLRMTYTGHSLGNGTSSNIPRKTHSPFAFVQKLGC